MKSSMCARATASSELAPESADARSTAPILGRLRGRRPQRGAALVATMVLFVVIAGLVVATTQISSIEVDASRRSLEDVRAAALAEAGIERAKATLETAAGKTAVLDPLDGIRAMFQGGSEVRLFDGAPMISNGANVGEYTTALSMDVDAANGVIVTITSTGYVPAAPSNLADGQRLEAWDSVCVTVGYDLTASDVFDNAYFINNWGWFYGDTIRCNGNARSNGQMDLGHMSATITGSPTYGDIDHTSGTPVLGDRASDGGVYASWDIVNAENATGIASDEDYRFDFEDPVEMPNLTDLTQYEDRALSENASISVGGTQVCDGVAGDGAGELENLYLFGTPTDPIVLDGPVVVRGDVIIHGVVTGQGSIYTGGNVYVPDSVEYLNGPPDSRPASNDDADVQQWLADNQGADFLGLFARENVIVGDYTHWIWQRYVGYWLSSEMNQSSEDSGEDQIPNTYAGRDGVAGTADDDVLEGDGVFTTDYYTAADQTSGLIPNGYSVGDRVPGSGEDIDGDGAYDDTITLSDFDHAAPLTTADWGGNMPPTGIAAYGDVASLFANTLDATIYTNHAFSWVVFGSDVASCNGAIVARNENIVYGTPAIEYNHDARLLGGTGSLIEELLPKTLSPARVLQWRRNEVDVFQAQP